MIERLTKDRAEQALQEALWDRERVLVVLDLGCKGDGQRGLIEVYSTRGVRCEIRTLLDLPDSMRTEAEEYLIATLPDSFKELYRGRPAGSAVIQRQTPEEALRWLKRKCELAMIREMQEALK